jgi:hypothetical protein
MLPKFLKKPPAKPKAQSSNVVAILHDPDTKKLTVTFHGGRIYRYDNVTADKHADLMKAESKSSFLNEHVIPHHTFSRLK